MSLWPNSLKALRFGLSDGGDGGEGRGRGEGRDRGEGGGVVGDGVGGGDGGDRGEGRGRGEGGRAWLNNSLSMMIAAFAEIK